MPEEHVEILEIGEDEVVASGFDSRLKRCKMVHIIRRDVARTDSLAAKELADLAYSVNASPGFRD